MSLSITTAIDASAAYGMLHRRGVGKMRHIDTSLLWVQEAAQTKKINFVKVDGKDLPADLMTKPPSRAAIEKFLKGLSTDRRSGRAKMAPTV